MDRRARFCGIQFPTTREAEVGRSLEPIKLKAKLGEMVKSHIGKGESLAW